MTGEGWLLVKNLSSLSAFFSPSAPPKMELKVRKIYIFYLKGAFLKEEKVLFDNVVTMLQYQYVLWAGNNIPGAEKLRGRFSSPKKAVIPLKDGKHSSDTEIFAISNLTRLFILFITTDYTFQKMLFIESEFYVSVNIKFQWFWQSAILKTRLKIFPVSCSFITNDPLLVPWIEW